MIFGRPAIVAYPETTSWVDILLAFKGLGFERSLKTKSVPQWRWLTEGASAAGSEGKSARAPMYLLALPAVRHSWSGRPSAPVTACSSEVRPPLVRVNQASTPPFQAPCQRLLDGLFRLVAPITWAPAACAQVASSVRICARHSCGIIRPIGVETLCVATIRTERPDSAGHIPNDLENAPDNAAIIDTHNTPRLWEQIWIAFQACFVEPENRHGRSACRR